MKDQTKDSKFLSLYYDRLTTIIKTKCRMIETQHGPAFYTSTVNNHMVATVTAR